MKTALLALLAVLLVGTAQAAEPEEIELTDWDELVYDPLNQMTEGSLSLQSSELYTEFSPRDTTYRDQLDGNPAQVIYDEIADILAQGEYTTGIITVGATSKEELVGYILGGFAAYDNDHPYESSVITGKLSYGYSSDFTYCKLVFPVISDPEEKLVRLDGALDTFLAAFREAGMEEADALTQYRYIHYYICDNLAYNYDAVGDQKDELFTEEQQTLIHNAYGALVGLDLEGTRQGEVVCQGYSDAYLLLCQTVGLPCVVVSGEGVSSGTFSGNSNHMWNAIKLSGSWYAVDTTWDDIDTTIQDDGMTAEAYVSTAADRYFTDNRYFLEQTGSDITRDHMAYSQCNFSGANFILGAPPLMDNSRLAETDLSMVTMTVILDVPADSDTGAFSDVQNVINTWGAQNLRFKDVPEVYILLPQRVEFSSACTVPAGKSYWMMTYNQETQAILTRREGFTGSLFSVSNQGSLFLIDMYLNGQGTAASQPLLRTDVSGVTDEGSNMALVYMNNTTVTGNQGAGGVFMDGMLILGGTTLITGNTNADGAAENLTLDAYGYVAVGGDLSGSSIGVTSPYSETGIVYPASYAWTEADRAVFTPDSDAYVIRYDAVNDMMFYAKLVTTDQTKGAWFTFYAVPTPASASGQEITLTMREESQPVQVLVAWYGENGRMLGVRAAEMTAEGTLCTVTLPEIPEAAASCRVFALDGTTPLSEKVEYSVTQ